MTMRGVILAGGLGSRLYPLTHATNKHLLPVYDRPMIYYPIQTLVAAGITDIIIVTGGPHAGDFLRVVRNGKQLGVRHLEYTYQEREGGIAEALSLCEDFADRHDICVILGDNTTDADIKADVEGFTEGARIFLKRVADPHRFGVVEFDAEDRTRISRILEKPKQPPTNLAVTGLYMYDRRVWDFIRRTKPSGRGELEITDVNNFYIEEGLMQWSELHGFWSDAGTFKSLFRTNRFWFDKATDAELDRTATGSAGSADDDEDE